MSQKVKSERFRHLYDDMIISFQFANYNFVHKFNGFQDAFVCLLFVVWFSLCLVAHVLPPHGVNNKGRKTNTYTYDLSNVVLINISLIWDCQLFLLLLHILLRFEICVFTHMILGDILNDDFPII